MRAVFVINSILLTLFFINAQVFIFELPELIVKINTTYLSKHSATRLRCEIFDNVANLSFSNVQWFKDNLFVNDLLSKRGFNDLILDGNELIITQGSRKGEGEYQCATVIENIPLTENTTINTRLISAPVRLRRARMSKFESVRIQNVRVIQGQVARIPCLGMPDSIPPALVWMEREGNEGVPLGMTGNLRFVSTPTGIQIAIAQPSDTGRYYCHVKNPYTNQTRKAPLPISLTVDTRDPQKEKTNEPTIVYPKLQNYSKPITVHAVVGQKVVLECVIWDSRTVWSTVDYSMPPVSLTDETARVRQIWGNLRFKSVQLNDSGLYECHGLDRFNEMKLQEPSHPRVRYFLKVHAPTNVNLLVTQSLYSKYLQMSCFVNNSGYEIPMVYVDGEPLIDAMENLGIPPQSNFFSNPVNVTLATNKPLTGSIQCISKPAMDEAEIYGDGLERGRSSNLYVTDRSSSIEKLIEQGPRNVTKIVGSDAQLTCVPASSDVKTRWLKNNHVINIETNDRMSIVGSATLMIKSLEISDQGLYTCVGMDPTRKSRSRVSAYLEVLNVSLPEKLSEFMPSPEDEPLGPLVILKPRGFVASGQNVRLQWGLPSNHPQLMHLASFDIELQKESSNSTDETWLRADIQVKPHVRAVTVRNLVPKNRYRFRIVGNLLNRTRIFSSPTDWMEITKHQGFLPEPVISEIFPLSYDSVQLSWAYLTGTEITEEDHFHINYQAIGNSTVDKDTQIVSGWNQAVIQNLEPETEYAISIYAVNNGVQSPVSKIRYIKTLPFNDNPSFGLSGSFNENSIWRHFFSTTNHMQFIATVILTAVVVVFIFCASCLFFWWLCSKGKKHCIDEKDFDKKTKFCLDNRAKGNQKSNGLLENEPTELSRLTAMENKQDNYTFYANQSPQSERFAGSRLDMRSTPTKRPKIINNNFAFDDISPSRISLDTVFGMRVEPRSKEYSTATLKGNRDVMHSYVNIGSEANLYSTVRRGTRSRLDSRGPSLPPMNRKPDTDTSALLEGINYSPESSTASPISHSPLNGQEVSRSIISNPPVLSTFRPAAPTKTINGSTLTLDRRRMNDSMIETPCDGDGPLPEPV